MKKFGLVLSCLVLILVSVAKADSWGNISCQTNAFDRVWGFAQGTYSDCHACWENHRGQEQIECRESCTKTSFSCRVLSMDVGAGGSTDSYSAQADSKSQAEAQARQLCQSAIAAKSAAFCLAEAICESVVDGTRTRSCH